MAAAWMLGSQSLSEQLLSDPAWGCGLPRDQRDLLSPELISCTVFGQKAPLQVRVCLLTDPMSTD